jgi:hypothetical protein
VVARADGVVLRYGALYGPDAIEGWMSLVRKRMFPIVGGGTGLICPELSGQRIMG